MDQLWGIRVLISKTKILERSKHGHRWRTEVFGLGKVVDGSSTEICLVNGGLCL